MNPEPYAHQGTFRGTPKKLTDGLILSLRFEAPGFKLRHSVLEGVRGFSKSADAPGKALPIGTRTSSPPDAFAECVCVCASPYCMNIHTYIYIYRERESPP